MALISKDTVDFLHEKILEVFLGNHPDVQRDRNGRPSLGQRELYWEGSKSIGSHMQKACEVEIKRLGLGRFNPRRLRHLVQNDQTVKVEGKGFEHFSKCDDLYLSVFLHYVGHEQETLQAQVEAFAQQMKTLGKVCQIQDYGRPLSPIEKNIDYVCIFHANSGPDDYYEFLITLGNNTKRTLFFSMNSHQDKPAYSGNCEAKLGGLKFELKGHQAHSDSQLSIMLSLPLGNKMSAELMLGTCARTQADNQLPISQFVAFMRKDVWEKEAKTDRYLVFKSFLRETTLRLTNYHLHYIEDFFDDYYRQNPLLVHEWERMASLKGHYECYSTSSSDNGNKIRRCVMEVKERGQVEYHNINDEKLEGRIVYRNTSNCFTVLLYDKRHNRFDLRYSIYLYWHIDSPFEMMTGVFSGRTIENKPLAGLVAVCRMGVPESPPKAAKLAKDDDKVALTLLSYPKLLDFLEGTTHPQYFDRPL